MNAITTASIEAANLALLTAYKRSRDQYQQTYMNAGGVLVPSSSRGNIYADLGTFPALKRWAGETKITTLDASAFTVLNAQFDASIGVPQAQVEDNDLFGSSQIMAGLGKRVQQHPDDLIFGLLNNAFTGTDYTNTAFFHTAKPWSGAKTGTVSNKGTGALAEATLRTGLAALANLKDPEGKPVNVGADIRLVVPPALAWTAKALVTAATGASGAENVMKGDASVVVSPWLTSTTAWFLIAVDPTCPALIYQERRKPEVIAVTTRADSEHLIKKRELLFNAYGRGEAAYGFWQRAYGSTGVS